MSSHRPGTLYEPEGAAPTTGGSRARCFAAGFRAGDLIHNCFSYHFTPGGAMLESGAPRAGAARCFAAAPARPSNRCRRWPICSPIGYVGTPSFLKIILERADELGVALASLEKGAGLR